MAQVRRQMVTPFVHARLTLFEFLHQICGHSCGCLPLFPASNLLKIVTMFLKVQLSWNVIIPAEKTDVKGLLLKRAIIVRLMEEFSSKKATKDLGYLLAVTTLDKVGEGRVRQQTGEVLFPVTFTCLTFKIFKGEVVEGVVERMMKHGVFLKCGPVETIFLSAQMMPGYQYVPGENPVFISEKQSKIEKDVVVRVYVIGVKWIESEREFQAVVSLDRDFLGPV